MNKEKAIRLAEKYGTVRALEKAWNITKKNINKIKIKKVNEESIKEYDYDIYKNHITIYATDEEVKKIINELNKKEIKIIEVKT